VGFCRKSTIAKRLGESVSGTSKRIARDSSIASEVDMNKVVSPRVHHAINYAGEIVLAPMVRIGHLSFRELCRSYGATVCYTPEIIDKALFKCQRIVDDKARAIRFERDGSCVLAVGMDEGPLVAQIGTADPALAVRAAKIVMADVDEINVNMGCPKSFSLKGGMGAALLRNKDLACAIIAELTAQIPLPITAKIRLLDTPNSVEDTIDFVQGLRAAGAVAVTIHGRRQHDRTLKVPADFESIAAVVRAIPDFPILANGDVSSWKGAQRVLALTGCVGTMTARAAYEGITGLFVPLSDESVASVEELPPERLAALQLAASQKYLEIHRRFEAFDTYQLVKYTISRMLVPSKCFGDLPTTISQAKSLAAIRDLLLSFRLEGPAPPLPTGDHQ
jgi:tRNA-dihydrouridine synthase 2